MNLHGLAVLPILLATLLMFTAKEGWADSWQQTGSARVSTEYDTNPAMSPTNQEGVSRHFIEPSYTLTGNFDRDVIRTGLALQLARSSNETLSQNRNSPTAFLDWLRQTETGEFGISSRYAETSTRNVGTSNTANTDPALADNTRASRALSGRWSNALTERSTLEATGAYETVLYTGGTYTNYATRSTGLMYSYLWSEAATPFLRMSRADYEPADGALPASFTNTVLAGVNWTATDALSGTLNAGQSKVSNADEASTQGGGSVRYSAERTQLSLSANRSVAPSGLGGFAIVDQVNGSWSYALSEHSSSGIDIGWQKRTVITDITNRTSGAWLQHELNSFLGVRTYYRHNTISRDSINDASSDILGIALTYTHTDF